MAFTLNFLGVQVADFAQSFRFYTEVLGIEAARSRADWALFRTRGMVFELFGGGPPSEGRAWGHGQAARASVQVADLAATVTALRHEGLQFTGDVVREPWGDQVEFVAPAGIRWTLAQTAVELPGADLRHARLGWVELKASDLSGQRAFYADVLGMRSEDAAGRVLCRQAPGEPFLVLEPGGTPPRASLALHEAPTWISFETPDIEPAVAWLKACGAPIIREVAEHSWGVDLHLADADRNPVQVVQYARPA